jgi:hypothetical protein
MNLINRMLGNFLLLTALLVTCASLSVDWLLGPGAWTNSLSDCIALIEAQYKGEQLTRESRSVIERLQLKMKVVEALKRGEITLLDAAACFCALHEDPRSWCNTDHPRPERDDGEGWCREVINWTERYMSGDYSPDQVAALRRRLEAELQEQLECNGDVTLPQ